MEVLLVRAISNSYIISPPIGLGYLATALRRVGHHPKILECVKERMDFYEFAEAIKRIQPDMIGFQVWSCDLPNIKRSLKIVKNVCPKAITIVGGAHPSGAPLETLDYLKEADFAIRGEGEMGLPLLADKLSGNNDVDLTQIPGLIWRANGRIFINPAIFVDDLDQFGMPAWDLIDPRDYPRAPHQGFAKAFPVAPIIVTRGCPFSCTFCATHVINGKRIRSRSVDGVIQEIKMLKDKYGVGEIHIEDDNFTFNREFVKEFCKRLITERLAIFWHCSSGFRLDSVDKETLLLMKESGCYTLTIAIEAGTQRILNLMRKRITLKQVRDAISLMNSVGYKPTGLFMIGFPGEKEEEIRQTIRFARSLDLKRAQFAIFHPLPGSKIFETLTKEGRLDNIEWHNIKPSEVAYTTENLSRKQLKRLQRIAFLRFHLRPHILIYQLREITSLNHLWFLLKRLIDMLGLNFWKR